ncbi:MAG: superoxide dismutase family protein [Beijerinckiaceae bacterium]
MIRPLSATLVFSLAAGAAWAQSKAAMPAPGPKAKTATTMYMLSESGPGKVAGTIVPLSSGPDGVTFDIDLKGVAPGVHGFHLHENPSCENTIKNGKTVPGDAAGGHYDPEKTGIHAGPNGKGHLGDLPRLTAGQDGIIKKSVIAPRLSLADVEGRSLMLHAGGDNYKDEPKPLGGGGARMICGVVGK